MRVRKKRKLWQKKEREARKMERKNVTIKLENWKISENKGNQMRNRLSRRWSFKQCFTTWPPFSCTQKWANKNLVSVWWQMMTMRAKMQNSGLKEKNIHPQYFPPLNPFLTNTLSCEINWLLKNRKVKKMKKKERVGAPIRPLSENTTNMIMQYPAISLEFG